MPEHYSPVILPTAKAPSKPAKRRKIDKPDSAEGKGAKSRPQPGDADSSAAVGAPANDRGLAAAAPATAPTQAAAAGAFNAAGSTPAAKTGSEGGTWVGIHSAFANTLALKMLQLGLLGVAYTELKREVAYGKQKSRVDFLLTQQDGSQVYLEVKSATLAESLPGAWHAAKKFKAILSHILSSAYCWWNALGHSQLSLGGRTSSHFELLQILNLWGTTQYCPQHTIVDIVC